MTVLIISLLWEHSKPASWAYEFVPMTFGKCPFHFILVFPFFVTGTVWAAAGNGVGIQVGNGSLSIHLCQGQSRGEAALGMGAGAYLNHLFKS